MLDVKQEAQLSSKEKSLSRVFWDVSGYRKKLPQRIMLQPLPLWRDCLMRLFTEHFLAFGQFDMQVNILPVRCSEFECFRSICLSLKGVFFFGVFTKNMGATCHGNSSVQAISAFKLVTLII